ncbi:hypothetical protein RQP46_003471 [Phenoliferia psychrophenolica]
MSSHSCSQPLQQLDQTLHQPHQPQSQHPHRPNPHLVGAFWLQALFLGASALGLLPRRKKAGSVEDRQEREERIEERERAEALEINLLLASYMPWPEDDTPLSALTPWIPLSASPTQPGKSIAAVTAALAQFSAAGLKPDRWTVLSLMSCVGALPTTPSSTPTKSDLARPVIALCAWRTFADLPRSPETAATDLALLRAFVDYLANPPPFAQDLTAELLASISHLLSTSPPPSLPIPNPYPSLIASLAPIALAHNNLGALQALIARESPLDPFQKIQMSVHTLELIAADEELRNTREVVRDFGEAFADNVRQLYGCGPREWARRIRPDKVALDAEGSEPVQLSVPPAEEEEDSADGRPTQPRKRNAAHRAQLRVNLIRRGIDLLRAEFRVDVPLEDLYADATLVLLTFTPSSLAESWLLTILRSLVASRHPRLALSLFDTVPSSSLTLDHFNALLRTHHLPTSSLVFLRLLSHPTLSPTLPSFHARLISHRHNLAVEPAHNDLNLMKSLDIPRDSKAWNLLLAILARAGSDRELFRHWVRMEQAGISPDVYSWNILLGRTTRARPPPRRDADVPSRRTTRGGAGRVGSSQLRTVIRTLESTTPSPELSIPASPSSVASNTLLRSLGRWSSEVNTPHLVALTRTVLGIDLVLDADDPFDGFRNKPVPTRLEWEEEREPAVHGVRIHKSALPMKAIVLKKTEGEFKAGKVYHAVPLVELPIPIPGPGQVLVKIIAAAYNHRDVFLRQSLYPGLIFDAPGKPSVMGADCVGVVVSPSHPLSNKPVLVHSAVNWESDPDGPDGPGPFGILGAVGQTQGRGTFAEYVVVGAEDVVACPEHFVGRGMEGWSEAASFPLGGLTAYRAVFTKAKVQAGQNVLITGIGGGVAITALQYCIALGANVWVSSSSEDKIARAVKLGAKGGINYKDAAWPKTLATLLPKDRPYLDAVIDSGGGPIVNQCTRVLKNGGVVSCYGMTAGGDVSVGMGAVLKNISFVGSTMGSRAEFKKAVAFISEHKIRPVVHTVLPGLAKAEEGFEIMKQGGQFGKIVIAISTDDKRKL